MRAHSLLPLLVLALASCQLSVIPDRHTSATYLSADNARHTVAGSLLATAHDVTQLFNSRQVNLASSATVGDALVLTYRGTRETLTGGYRIVTSTTIGSEFVATLRPVPGGSTQIEIVGRPLANGGQPYVVSQKFTSDDFDYTHVSGHDEADMITGLFSELSLMHGELPARTQDVAAAAPPPPEPKADSACLDARHVAFRDAEQTQDLTLRARILHDAPECPAQ